MTKKKTMVLVTSSLNNVLCVVETKKIISDIPNPNPNYLLILSKSTSIKYKVFTHKQGLFLYSRLNFTFHPSLITKYSIFQSCRVIKT